MSAGAEFQCRGCRHAVEVSVKYCPYCGIQLRLDPPPTPSEARALPQDLDTKTNSSTPSTLSPSVSAWEPLGVATRVTISILFLAFMLARGCRKHDSHSNLTDPVTNVLTEDSVNWLTAIVILILVIVWLVAIVTVLARLIRRR